VLDYTLLWHLINKITTARKKVHIVSIFIALEPGPRSPTHVHWNIVTCPAVEEGILSFMYKAVCFFLLKKSRQSKD